MDKRVTFLTGDWVAMPRTLPDESVQCVVTSPPYWGLRDYGVAGQLGLERAPQEYVEKLVAGFREVRRVLRKDGTCWVNLGDSFAGSGKGGNPGANGREKQRTNEGSQTVRGRRTDLIYTGPERGGNTSWSTRDVSKTCPAVGGLKTKDLVGIPWRVAFALQEDGWWLRSDIIWAKPNPMPESVRDRPTKAHEYIFLLTKSERYFYDAEAIKEACSPATHARISQDLAHQVGSFRANGGNKTNGPMKAVVVGSTRKLASQSIGGKQNPSYQAAMALLVSSRNRRSVWTVASAPFRGAHFATFPPKLIEPCILAGTSEHGACADCGAPYRRVLAHGHPRIEQQRACGGAGNGEYAGKAVKDYAGAGAQNASEVKARILRGMVEKKTTGWEPTCECHGSTESCPTRPCMVLDPFGGAGTTGLVAARLGRQAILIELKPAYVRMAKAMLTAETQRGKI